MDVPSDSVGSVLISLQRGPTSNVHMLRPSKRVLKKLILVFTLKILGRDKDAVRTYYERAKAWQAPTEPVRSRVRLLNMTWTYHGRGTSAVSKVVVRNYGRTVKP